MIDFPILFSPHWSSRGKGLGYFFGVIFLWLVIRVE